MKEWWGTMTSTSIRACLLAVLISTSSCVAAVWCDPPGRVGRLNFVSGTVSFHPESVDDWAPATLNYPLTIGDNLWTDQDGQAEIHIGSTAIRLASNTGISFLNLNDQTIQIRVSTGSLDLRLRHLGPSEQIELDTPNSSLSLLRAGTYRVDVQQTGDTTVTVRAGEAEVTAGSSVFPVPQNRTAAVTGLDSPSYEVMAAPARDDWDNWCLARDQKENEVASAQYVSSDEMSGTEDLDLYGSWASDPDYGPVWTPRVVVEGWAPYHFGHWVWVDPWGWTWIDDAAWGFAPFHYGRWVFRNRAWGWVPGERKGRAVYSPALVAFVGGGGWRSSQAPGEDIGWIPLGPHEPYVASYRTDHTRLHNVDVEHLTYANRSVPGGMTFIPADAFVRGLPAARASLHLSNDELMKAPVRGAAAPLIPQKESFLGTSVASHGIVAHPPASVMSRPVVARLTPPPQSVPFAARQKAFGCTSWATAGCGNIVQSEAIDSRCSWAGQRRQSGVPEEGRRAIIVAASASGHGKRTSQAGRGAARDFDTAIQAAGRGSPRDFNAAIQAAPSRGSPGACSSAITAARERADCALSAAIQAATVGPSFEEAPAP